MTDKSSNNPTQWPSFTNLSVWYAERALHRIDCLSVPAILLQRWWRQRKNSRKFQKLYPIVLQRRAFSVGECTMLLAAKSDPTLQARVFAHEKLDGTNLGIRCDGVIFGRRQRVIGTSYQKCALTHGEIIPTVKTVNVIKNVLAESVETDEKDNVSSLKLMLYGELMCNSGRYGYQERGMSKSWLCFGAMLATASETKDAETIAMAANRMSKLENRGFLVTMSPETGTITFRLNDTLRKLLELHGVNCVPPVDSGSLVEVCSRLKDKMTGDEPMWEGLVLTGKNFIHKWKIRLEDESKGHDMLFSVQQAFHSTVLQLAGVEEGLLQCLMEVSRTKKGPREERRAKGGQKVRNTAPDSAYEATVLQTALDSALTKYDALEEFFARDERNAILDNLRRELHSDLAHETPDEIKCVEKYVAKHVGTAFRKWKQRKRS